jgi:hypothetical protein
VVSVIAALIGVTACCVAVLQFFFALDQSPWSAAKATWVFQLSRWCRRSSRRCHELLARGLRRREERATATWSVQLGLARREAAQSLVREPRPVTADGDPTWLTRRRHPEWPSQPREPDERIDGNDERIDGNGAGALHAARVTAASVRAHSRSNERPSISPSGRAHWVWVTRPSFYAEADGSDRIDLDPSMDYEPCGWWTCDESTRQGDLVLVYRTAPRKDLRYLVEADSDAYPLDDDLAAPGGRGCFGCDYRVLHKLDPPISLAKLRADPVTARWKAVHVNFQGRSLVPPEAWERLAALIEKHDPRGHRVLREAASRPVRRGSLSQRELRDRLFNEPERLRRIGLDAEVVGRQIRHPHGGVLDLLLRNKRNGEYVVVALTPGRGGRAAVTQLLEHVASVPQLQENPYTVRGLLIAADLDPRTELMLTGAGSLDFARLEDLGLSARTSPQAIASSSQRGSR